MSARRRARAAAMAAPVVEGLPVPPELLDGDHVVWHHQGRYRAWMHARGWSMPASERFGVPAHPVNRRKAAARGWVREAGLDAGWRRLVEWGVCG